MIFSGVFICMSIDGVLNRFPFSFFNFLRGFTQIILSETFSDNFLREFSQIFFSEGFLR